jgi:pimeloyl-ACP methyl ester carboxylesterase/uncharacterized protein YndB with AHSA1/START domain
MNHLPFDFTVDKSTNSVCITREFAAELSLVWDAFTKPEILDQWWAPKPLTSKTKSMDFKVGGRRFYAMVGPDGQENWGIQIFTSISPKTAINWVSSFADKDENVNAEIPSSEWDLTFSEQAEKTKVSIVIKHKSLANIELLLKMGFKEGFAITLNSLEELVMKRGFKGNNIPKSLLTIAIFLFTVFQSYGQHSKPTATGYAPVNGIKVYYEVYGKGSPIVLLHGAFYDINMNWSQLIPELSKTRKVIALEFQGHGHTPFSDRKLDIVTFASDVAGVMNYLKVDSADVAGFSMGGSVAYQLAIQNPKRVRKLVVISSTYKTSGWLPQVNGAHKDFSPDFFDNTPLQAAYDATAPDKTKWRKFVKQMIVFAATPFDCGDANIAKMAMPVLLISGDNDGVDKMELMKTYRLLGGDKSADLEPMPKSHLAIVPSQGHVSLMMQTKEIVSYLDTFLK